jgi:electron transfer flavoprotein beta subunit
MAFQVGQLVAALLDIPCATSVICEEMCLERGEILVEREIEGGRRQSLLLSLPAVLTIQSGINVPRYPSLSNVLRARSQPQEIIASQDFGISPEREDMTSLRHPDFPSPGMFIEGSPREKARTLLAILHEKSLLLQR